MLFLPASSPDFAPSEEAFSTLKAWLRRLGARTRAALEAASAQAHSQLPALDARGWFGPCGYLLKRPDSSRTDAASASWLNYSALRSKRLGN